MNMFSTDHCDGQVVYWKAPIVGVVPIAWQEGYHMTVPLTMDGHQWRALIDTGATGTVLYSNDAKLFYNLTLGDADTPENGHLNGDQALTTYGHVFKSLSFGNVVVNNPHVTIAPNATGRNLSKEQLVGDRTKSEKDLIAQPDMIIGMNVLRKLHIYFAMKEDKLYISDASATAAQPAQAATGQ
jgi:predicted aspartyl protease